MLLDCLSSKQVLSIQTMGDDMSCRRMDTRQHHMRSFRHQVEVGKTRFYRCITRKQSFVRFQGTASLWVQYYSVMSMLIIPLAISLVSNGLIFFHVRASSRRVQAGCVSDEERQQPKISQRDLSLLRHMIIMFCITLGGWAPVPVYQVIAHYRGFNRSIFQTLSVWYQLALLVNIADLFLYNHELRRYMSDLCQRCWRKCRKNENIPQIAIAL